MYDDHNLTKLYRKWWLESKMLYLSVYQLYHNNAAAALHQHQHQHEQGTNTYD